MTRSFTRMKINTRFNLWKCLERLLELLLISFIGSLLKIRLRKSTQILKMIKFKSLVRKEQRINLSVTSKLFNTIVNKKSLKRFRLLI